MLHLFPKLYPNLYTHPAAWLINELLLMLHFRLVMDKLAKMNPSQICPLAKDRENLVANMVTDLQLC